MNERPGNFTRSFQPPTKCPCRWLPPTGDYSICHFSLSFFVVFPSSVPCHLWYLHSAGDLCFQLRHSPCVVKSKLATCDRHDVTLLLCSIAVGKSNLLLPPSTTRSKVRVSYKTSPLSWIQTILLALPPFSQGLKRQPLLVKGLRVFLMNMLTILYIFQFQHLTSICQAWSWFPLCLVLSRVEELPQSSWNNFVHLHRRFTVG